MFGVTFSTVASGSFMSPQLRTVGKKNVSHWLRSGRKIEVELAVRGRIEPKIVVELLVNLKSN